MSLPNSSLPEILNIQQAAEFLNLSRRSVYEMTRVRGRNMPIPVPLLRINSNIRFRRADLEQWLDQLAEYERTGVVPKGRAQ